ncbi:MAG TPA: catalase family peroxidase [Burkholderiales bacterium]|nr:catalase family peroxidase [Burkholderiales bacterium]
MSVPLRLLTVAVIVGAAATSFAYAGGWLTPHALTPARIANRFEQVNGVHPGFRRNHAKGVDVSGYFESTGQGAALSRASVFRPGRVPVLGRFSLGGGQPFAVDAEHTPRGLGVRFALRDGEEWRTAMLGLPVFPVSTPEAFYDQLLAMAPDPATGQPDPARVSAFLARHPESARALQVISSQPMSSGFDNSSYHSLNAFRFIDAAGTVSWVRWSLVPVPPPVSISATAPGATSNNFLFDALIASVRARPPQWRLVVTVAQPGDPTNDATIPWPADRRTLEAGTLTFDRIESDDTSPARDINFDPLILPNGMAPSDDPLLSARSAVYSQSFTRREGEPRIPSAVSPGEAAR